MKQGTILAILISLSLFLKSCNTIESTGGQSINLKLEDVSCIEAWINLTTTNLQLPTTLTLEQINPTGDTKYQILNLNTQDSLLYVDSLLPNQTYKFNAAIQPYKHTSNELSVTTLDTTSHNFTFETFTFGEHSSSVLYDVVIINENNIWAVGEIYLNDSLGQPDPKRYNAVIWNGNDWTVIRIPYNYQGTDFYHPIQSVFAFGPNDIWFCGNGVIHWDGNSFIPIPIPTNVWGPYQMNKLWGSSSSDLYVVGNEGNIAWYNGQSWQRIESGTGLNIGDIWGISDGNGSYNKFLAAVNAMLKIDNNTHLTRIDAEAGHSLGSDWGVSNRLIYTAGGYGLTLYKNYKWENIYEPITSTIRVIRGQNHNDVYGLGTPGTFVHFNGYRWQSISSGINNILYRLEVKDDLIMAVGWQGEKAAITICRKN